MESRRGRIHYCIFINPKDHGSVFVIADPNLNKVQAFRGSVSELAVGRFGDGEKSTYSGGGDLISRYEYALSQAIGKYYIPKWRSFAETRSEAFEKAADICMRYCNVELGKTPEIKTWFNNG